MENCIHKQLTKCMNGRVSASFWLLCLLVRRGCSWVLVFFRLNCLSIHIHLIRACFNRKTVSFITLFRLRPFTTACPNIESNLSSLNNFHVSLCSKLLPPILWSLLSLPILTNSLLPSWKGKQEGATYLKHYKGVTP